MLCALVICLSLSVLHFSQATLPPAALFVGMGYNLLKGNPDGDSHINTGKDPGLLMTRQILKLDPPDSPRELSYHEYPLCFPTHYKEVFYGTKSYQTRLLHDLIDIGNTTDDISTHAFSLSEGYQSVSHETYMGDFVYIDEISLCNKGRSRYMTNLASSHKFNVGDEFAATVCSLSGIYDNQSYMDFLQDWGTHVVMGTEIGWEKKIRKRVAVEDIVSSLIGTHPELLVPTGAARGQTSSVSLSKTFTDNPTYLDTPYLNSKMTSVSSTSKGSEQVSEPIKYKVVSIDEMLDAKFWQTPQKFEDERLCKRNFVYALPVWRKNIQQALKAYSAYLRAPDAKDSAPSYPVSWPSSPFALLEPNSGCPTDDGPWETGSTTHTVNSTIASDPNNTFQYQELHIKGLHGPTTLEMSYCGRVEDSVHRSHDWPAGSYCLDRASDSCPSGFRRASITHGLQSIPHINYYESPEQTFNSSGSVPSLQISDQYYVENFCCRNDGSESAPIILPHQEPFYLYPEMRTKKCQKVLGMRSTDGWIRYPYTYTGSQCSSYYSSSSNYPYDEDCTHHHKIHYCYYTKETPVSSIDVVGRK